MFLISNCRSITNKVDELIAVVSNYNPDFVCISETWLDCNYPSALLNIDNYYLYRNDRNSHGGGVAIWSRYICNEISVDLPHTINSNILALCVPELRALLIIVYHPYWGHVSQHEDVIDSLQCCLDNNDNYYDNIYICGDFNDLRLHFDNFAQSNNLTQIIKFPTRGKNTLDRLYVPVNAECHYKKITKISPIGNSDHCVCFVKPDSAKIDKSKMSIRDFSPQNHRLFELMISSICWNVLFRNIATVDAMVDIYNNTLSNIFSICFPKKTVTLSSKDKPWITPSIKLLMTQKDRAFNRGNKSTYLHLRDRLNKEILSKKQSYYSRKLKSNLKHKWKTVNEIIKPEKRRNIINSSTAKDLNTSFGNVFITDNKMYEIKAAGITQTHDDIEEFEVFNTITSIKSNSAGIDEIPGFIYRRYAIFLSFPLKLIFNCSLHQKCFPSAWKLSNVVPIPKSSKDFRPISLLSFPSKVLEKIVLNKIIIPIACDKFSPHQYGFIPRSFTGTTAATLSIRLNALNKITSHGGYVRCLAIDFYKAFDRVSHYQLLKSADLTFHLPHNILQWLSSYLNNRKQRVTFGNNEHTEWKSCTSGVPQGSVLGPFLFCMLINSFKTVSDRSSFALYADDLTILHHVPPGETDDIAKEMDNLSLWCARNKMCVNPLKCRVINFSLSLRYFDTIYINNTLVSEVHSLKLLGVIFTSNFKHCDHARMILAKCATGMAAVRKLKQSGLT